MRGFWSFPGLVWLVRQTRPRARVFLALMLAVVCSWVVVVISADPAVGFVFGWLGFCGGLGSFVRRDASMGPVAGGVVLGGLGSAVVVPQGAEAVWILAVVGWFLVGMSAGKAVRAMRLHRFRVVAPVDSGAHEVVLCWQHRSNGRWLRLRNVTEQIVDPSPAQLREAFDRIDALNAWAVSVTRGADCLELVSSQPGDAGLYLRHGGRWETLVPLKGTRTAGHGAWDPAGAWSTFEAFARGGAQPVPVVFAEGRRPYPRSAFRELVRADRYRRRGWAETAAMLREIAASSQSVPVMDVPALVSYGMGSAAKSVETTEYVKNYEVYEREVRIEGLLASCCAFFFAAFFIVLLVDSDRPVMSNGNLFIALIGLGWSLVGIGIVVALVIRAQRWKRFRRSSPGQLLVKIAPRRIFRIRWRRSAPKDGCDYGIGYWGEVVSSECPGIEPGQSLYMRCYPDSAPDIHRQGLYRMTLSVAYGSRRGRAWASGQIDGLWWPVTFERSKSSNKSEQARYFPYTPHLTER